MKEKIQILNLLILKNIMIKTNININNNLNKTIYNNININKKIVELLITKKIIL